jgi:glyoxylase-like metal-dependent hydrolase (beta-lactamase superfamily II)
MMIEEVFRNIFKIEIPLPQNPLRFLNSYFIRGRERNLLIDSGFNRPECREAMDRAILDIGFSMVDTDIFVTHLHGDHSGLSAYLSRPENTIRTGVYTARYLTTGEGGAQFEGFVIQSGLAAMGISPYDKSVHPGYKYASGLVSRAGTVADGDIVQVGDLSLLCIETSGHCPDHMCLYEPEQKILFSGDHILGTITPNISIWNIPWELKVDYLGSYLKNLDKIAALETDLVLPGHRSVLKDCRKRIEELKIHHKNRLNSILEILGDKKMNGAEVASKMKWDLKANSWEEFPPAQKFFATAEALSHLAHLGFQNVLVKELRDGVVYYSRVA